MKKQNILDILTQEFITERKVMDANFERCISDFELVKAKYISSFLERNQKEYGYVFNLNSNDKDIMSDSYEMLDNMAYCFKELVSECPVYFLDNVKIMGFELACDMTCFNVLLYNDIDSILLPKKKEC